MSSFDILACRAIECDFQFVGRLVRAIEGEEYFSSCGVGIQSDWGLVVELGHGKRGHDRKCLAAGISVVSCLEGIYSGDCWQ